jgi:endonuclease YncB( thermonuclease family)
VRWAAGDEVPSEVLPKGTKVRLVSDTKHPLKDRYGRLLRYMTKISNGLDTGRVQVKRGWAKVFVVGRGFQRVKSYRTAQRQARAAAKGTWGLC